MRSVLLAIALSLTATTASAVYLPPPPPQPQPSVGTTEINDGFEIFEVFSAPHDPEYDGTAVLCLPATKCQVTGTAQQLLDRQFGKGVVTVVAFSPVIRTYDEISDYRVSHLVVSFRRVSGTHQ